MRICDRCRSLDLEATGYVVNFSPALWTSTSEWKLYKKDLCDLCKGLFVKELENLCKTGNE